MSSNISSILGSIISPKRCLETFLGCRIAPIVQVKEIQGRSQVGNLESRGIGLGAAELLHDLGSNEANQQTEDGKHHQQFHEGETRDGALTI